MNEKIDKIFSVLKEKKSLVEKGKTLLDFLNYYRKLQHEIKTGKVYHQLRNQNKEFVNFVEKLTPDDLKLLDCLFTKDVKKYLENIDLENNLDFTKFIGVSQAGPNVVYPKRTFQGAMTIGKVTFYIPTKKGLEHQIMLEIFNFVPLTLKIEFENHKLIEEEIPKLKSKKFNFTISSEQITNTVSELSVSTDKLWLPSRFLEVDPKPLGVLVKSIKVSCQNH